MESPSATPRLTDDGRVAHIFTELRSHDDLLLPVRGSKRLKYTCITCSRQYIALGSSHGGLYVFQRDSLKYLQQIGNKEGLTKALFSPDENVIGMATSGGAIIIWKLNMTSRQKAERLVMTQTHRHHQITSLCWDGAGLRLFSADERGRITVTNTDSSKPSGIFKFQSELVIDVDSSVVQMGFAEERLLISTLTRCYLCDPKKRLSFQIGTKLRDGSYGACFLKKPGSDKPSIFCARPGSRMWEANTLCQVLNTHQFKQLLATHPLPVMGKGRDVTLPTEESKHPPQSLAFPVLHPLGTHFLVTWNDHGVYVFDPVNVNVVFWTSDISDLLDVSVSKSSLYCLHNDGHIRKYTLQNIARSAASLYQQGLPVQCSRLVLRFQTEFRRSRSRRHMPPHTLHDLAKQVATEDSILGCNIEELAVDIENRIMDVSSALSSRRSSFDSYDGMRLQSGIYVVRKRMDSECSDDMPLGYDAHMDHLKENQESTKNSRQEAIKEVSPSDLDKNLKISTPIDDANLVVKGSFDVENPPINPESEILTKAVEETSSLELDSGSNDGIHSENANLKVVDILDVNKSLVDLENKISTQEIKEESLLEVDRGLKNGIHAGESYVKAGASSDVAKLSDDPGKILTQAAEEPSPQEFAESTKEGISEEDTCLEAGTQLKVIQETISDGVDIGPMDRTCIGNSNLEASGSSYVGNIEVDQNDEASVQEMQDICVKMVAESSIPTEDTKLKSNVRSSMDLVDPSEEKYISKENNSKSDNLKKIPGSEQSSSRQLEVSNVTMSVGNVDEGNIYAIEKLRTDVGDGQTSSRNLGAGNVSTSEVSVDEGNKCAVQELESILGNGQISSRKLDDSAVATSKVSVDEGNNCAVHELESCGESAQPSSRTLAGALDEQMSIPVRGTKGDALPGRELVNIPDKLKDATCSETTHVVDLPLEKDVVDSRCHNFLKDKDQYVDDKTTLNEESAKLMVIDSTENETSLPTDSPRNCILPKTEFLVEQDDTGIATITEKDDVPILAGLPCDVPSQGQHPKRTPLVSVLESHDIGRTAGIAENTYDHLETGYLGEVCIFSGPEMKNECFIEGSSIDLPIEDYVTHGKQSCPDQGQGLDEVKPPPEESVDGSVDQQATISNPGQDLDRDESSVQGELMIRSTGFDQPLTEIDASDNGNTVEESELVGTAQQNQRFLGSTLLKENHNFAELSTDHNDFTEVCEERRNEDSLIESLQSLRAADCYGVIEDKPYQNEDKERPNQHEDQRNAEAVAASNGIEEEMSIDKNIYVLPEICHVEEGQIEGNFNAASSMPQFQHQDLAMDSTDEALSKLDTISSSYESKEQITMVEATLSTPVKIDVSGFGVDVSGFGISPSEKTFYHANDMEQLLSHDQNANKPHDYTAIVSGDQNENEQSNKSNMGSSSRLPEALNTNLPSSCSSENLEKITSQELNESNFLQTPSNLSVFPEKTILKPPESPSTNLSVSPEQATLNFSDDSSENLEIIQEDSLDTAEEEDEQFPDAEGQIVHSVTGSRYDQRETKPLSLEKINREPSGDGALPVSGKRKKTRSRIIDITDTVSSKPSSPLQSLSPGTFLYRPTSLPDLSPQSPSRPPVQHTPSSKLPSPARSPAQSPSLSPRKESRGGVLSPAIPSLPSTNLMMAATSGLPSAGGLMEAQQLILSSTAQINLKSVKESLASKLTKTKTFLQSMSDSNPLSPKEGEQSVPPRQPRPSPSSSPISASPTHKRGVSPSLTNRGIPQSSAMGRSPVSSPSHWPHPPGGRDFPHSPSGRDFPQGLDEEEAREEQFDTKLTEELIKATENTILAIRDPHTRYNPNALRPHLHTWVRMLERTYSSMEADGSIPWSSHFLPAATREDVGCLAMLCISLDIYANELGDEMEDSWKSELEEEGKMNSDNADFDECRALFIKRHFILLESSRILKILEQKKGCCLASMKVLLQLEADGVQSTNISEALRRRNAEEAFDLMSRANLASVNLPLTLSFLQRLCSLDTTRAIDMMISDYPTISPWHAYYVMYHLDEYRSLVVDYVESALLTLASGQRENFMGQVMSMKPLVTSLAEAALTCDPPSSSDLFCICGELPKLGSHLMKWSHDHVLQLLLAATGNLTDILLQNFLRAGYWRGAVMLMARAAEHKMAAIKLCIQLGDEALLTDTEADLIPSSKDDWQSVLRFMKRSQPTASMKGRQPERKCMHCGISLTPCTVQMSSTSETMSEEIFESEKPAEEEMVERLSPHSQPECDWPITEFSGLGNQSGSTKDIHVVQHDRIVEKSDDVGGVGENAKSASNQSNNHILIFDQSDVTDQSQNDSERGPTELNRLNITNTTPSPLQASDWLPTITWQKIALLLVSRLGAAEGVKMLREAKIPEGFLGREFHQLCIYASVWEKKQRLLSHAMLEGTDTYLWSKRQPLLGPVLHHSVRSEYQAITEGCTDTVTEREKALKTQKVLSEGQLFIEDPGTHWGRTTNLARKCSICRQSLAWSSTRQSSGCLVFPCGHVFHSSCIPEKACITCFYGNQNIQH